MTIYAWIWQDSVGALPAGVVPLVRAANGNVTTAPNGVDFAKIYQAWSSKYGVNIPAWTYIYPGDSGSNCATALYRSTPSADFYVADIEDSGVSAQLCLDFYSNLKRLSGKPIYLSSYGLLSQVQQRGIRTDIWDGYLPQTYYPYQETGLSDWLKLGRRVIATVSPADNQGWATVARQTADYSVWRYGVVDLNKIVATVPSRSTPKGPVVEKLGGVSVGGVASVSDGTSVTVFTIGADNTVWAKTWNGTSWLDWTQVSTSTVRGLSATLRGKVYDLFLSDLQSAEIFHLYSTDAGKTWV